MSFLPAFRSEGGLTSSIRRRDPSLAYAPQQLTAMITGHLLQFQDRRTSSSIALIVEHHMMSPVVSCTALLVGFLCFVDVVAGPLPHVAGSVLAARRGPLALTISPRATLASVPSHAMLHD